MSFIHTNPSANVDNVLDNVLDSVLDSVLYIPYVLPLPSPATKSVATKSVEADGTPTLALNGTLTPKLPRLTLSGAIDRRSLPRVRPVGVHHHSEATKAKQRDAMLGRSRPKDVMDRVVATRAAKKALDPTYAKKVKPESEATRARKRVLALAQVEAGTFGRKKGVSFTEAEREAHARGMVMKKLGKLNTSGWKGIRRIELKSGEVRWVARLKWHGQQWEGKRRLNAEDAARDYDALVRKVGTGGSVNFPLEGSSEIGARGGGE